VAIGGEPAKVASSSLFAGGGIGERCRGGGVVAQGRGSVATVQERGADAAVAQQRKAQLEERRLLRMSINAGTRCAAAAVRLLLAPTATRGELPFGVEPPYEERRERQDKIRLMTIL
jgi:hypothetical protein